MTTRDQFIIDVWERMGKDVVGASELDAIQQAIAERFGAETSVSSASIARTLADHGFQLGHPEVLQTDLRWREGQQLFTPEDLTFGTLDAATALLDRIEGLRSQLENTDHLRQLVRQMKTELELLAASERVPERTRQLAGEVAQWLTVWLQNPEIFSEWLDLRRSTPEFGRRFSRINTDKQSDPC